ncbi:MFS transporter [Rubrobacter marinus]|uniref:MFS transporter n=1 Tax=Rubrobacter marinus TaxID=2653852 RepID=UPI001A9F2808|nr:MFS transporter [Rubrobacter marinus]
MLVLISAVFVSVLNSSMVNVVVPVIGREFGASAGQVGWVITGYLLVYAVGIPLYGRISDLYSLRSTFTLGLVTFAVGSLVGALAPNLVVLVLGRILQAAGGAAIPALASASVAKLLPPGERGYALGLVLSSVGVGAAVGPVVGGTLAGFAGWQSLFYASLALAALLVVGAWFVLPHTRPSGERSFDLPGGVLLGLAAGLFLFGVTQGQVEGFGSPSSWGSFLVSAVSAVGFALRIRTAAHPFAPPDLFRNGPYVAAVAVGFFSMLANVTSLVFVPLLVSEVNGLSPARAGLVLAPGRSRSRSSPLRRAPLRPRRRPGADLRRARGMLVSALFLSSFGRGLPVSGLPRDARFRAGFAFANSATNNAAQAVLPREEVGVGIGIFQGLFFLGGGRGPR